MTIFNNDIKKHLSAILLLLLFFPIRSVAQNQLSNLPTLYITTNNGVPVADKNNYVKGNIVIKSSVPSEALSATTEIRLRGNSTVRMDKKSFRIKLESKARLLNLPANAKSWVLLANYADKTLIRNALAFEIGNILGFDFTPSVRFVDVVLNGTYLGNYMLTDQIQVNKNRVDIDEQEATDVTEPNITGGYLLEQAGDPSDEPVWFYSGKGMKLVVKSPDSDIINSKQLSYIKNYIANFETRLFSADFADPDKGYRAMVDTTSLINWYIACELTGNPDSFWSTYFYKKRSDDKLYFGPLWDFDIAFNNDNRLGDATAKLMREAAWDPKAWILQMWQDDWFREAVWKRWQELIADDLLESLISYMDETSQLIDESQKLNFTKWNILNTQVYLETFLFPTYKEGVDYLKTYMGKRIDFLTESFANHEADKPSVPFVPADDYYTIKNKRTGNLITVNQNSLEPDATLVFWEPVENNEAQLWKFTQINDDLFQIVNKNSGLAMAGNGYGHNLIQVPVNAADPAQRWYVKPVKTGNLYGIVNEKSGYSVNNSGGNYENGTNTIEWNNNISGSENQQYYIRAAGGTSGISKPETLIAQTEIYPNPATEQVQVKLIIDKPQYISISIDDLQGRQRYWKATELAVSGNYDMTISLTDFEPGLYLITISNREGERHVGKLIIVR